MYVVIKKVINLKWDYHNIKKKTVKYIKFENAQ